MNRLLTMLAMTLGLLGVLPSSACAQSGAISGGSFSLDEGWIALRGNFEDLRAIGVTSEGGFLQLPEPDFDLAPLPGGWIWENDENSIFIANNVDSVPGVDIANTTRTGIRFTESAEVAASDLSLNVTVGYCDSVDIPLNSAINFACDATRGDIAPDASFSVENGRVTLNGFIRELSSIQVQADSSGLSIASGHTFFSKAPFNQEANFVRSTPYQIILGVLGADKRIDVEAPVVTVIEYGGDASEIQDDLIVNVSRGAFEPSSTSPFSIVDGRLTFGVDIDDFAGFEVFSRGGYLSVATISAELPGVGASTTPFVAGDIVSNSSTEVLLRGTAQSVAGVTPTAILYDGAPDTFTDLVVEVTTASGEQARLPYAVPEPRSFCCLCLIVGLGFVARFRRRR